MFIFFPLGEGSFENFTFGSPASMQGLATLSITHFFDFGSHRPVLLLRRKSPLEGLAKSGSAEIDPAPPPVSPPAFFQ
jgi:hypothetical protein